MAGLKPRDGIDKIKGHMAPLAQPASDRVPVIKLASNESALGPSPDAVRRAKAACDELQWYAESEGTRPLQEAIGRRFGLDPDRVVVGPGSDEIIGRLVRGYLGSGEELVFNRRGYAKFANYALAVDGVPVGVEDEDYVASVDAILAAVGPRTRVVALANPDNPLGTYLPFAEVERLRRELPEGILLVLDGAYAEFAEAADYRSGTSLTDTRDDVAVTRTFSKIFGLAGLRLGWAYAAPGIVDTLRRLSTTFPVSGVAIAAGVAALEDRDHTARVAAHNASFRTWLSSRLGELGFRPVPSQTNFVLAEMPEVDMSSDRLTRLLADRGILVRNFPHTGPRGCLRITIGTAPQMHALDGALRDLLPRPDGGRRA